MYDLPNKFLKPQGERNPLYRIPSTKQIQTLGVERLEKHFLAVQNHLLKKEIQLYEWRQKTDFPVVKIDSYKVVEEKLEKTHLEVIINACYETIAYVRGLKVEDATVLIKEAFIGFERLFNKFRAFQVKPEMIVIDQRNKCRVWINSNFSFNQVERELKDFDKFYKNIVNVFEGVTVRTPVATSFYLNLGICNCFIKGLKFIQNFVKKNKLKPSTKPQFIKKTASTPNLIPYNPSRHVVCPIQQQPLRNLRQTIGCLRNKQQQAGCKSQAMTFAGKSTRVLQKRLQEMIQQIPKAKIAEKNGIILERFREKQGEGGGEGLKKVFRSIKEFRFRKGMDEQQKVEQGNSQIEGVKEEEKSVGIDKSKLRFQTTRPQFQPSPRKNYQFVLKNLPTTKPARQQPYFHSVTQTRSTSFFNNSSQKFQKFSPQQNSTHSSKKFGNIKFSEISHKKNSEMSDFNKEIENILFGIEGREGRKEGGEQGVESKSLHHNVERSQHNISILEYDDYLQGQGFNKKLSFTKTSMNPTSNNKTSTINNDNQKLLNQKNNNNNKNTITPSPAKYGAINDQVQQPTAQEISRKYTELGWKNTFNFGSLNEEAPEMKESIHAGQEQRIGVGLGLGVEKRPMVLGKLDMIKNKQLVMSVMNNEEGFGFGGM